MRVPLDKRKELVVTVVVRYQALLCVRERETFCSSCFDLGKQEGLSNDTVLAVRGLYYCKMWGDVALSQRASAGEV